MELKDAYQKKMTAQLKELSAKIDLLEAKVGSAKADMRVTLAEELHELRSKWRAASEKMKVLENSSGEAWEQVKETADQIWEELKSGVSKAHDKFK